MTIIKQVIILIIIVVAISLVNGCKTFQAQYQEMVKVSNPVLLYDSYITEWTSRCRERCWNWMEAKGEPLVRCGIRNVEMDIMARNLPIIECSGIAGFKLEFWGLELIPTIKKLNRLAEINN